MAGGAELSTTTAMDHEEFDNRRMAKSLTKMRSESLARMELKRLGQRRHQEDLLVNHQDEKKSSSDDDHEGEDHSSTGNSDTTVSNQMLAVQNQLLQEKLTTQEKKLVLAKSHIEDLAARLAAEEQSHVRHMTAAKRDYLKQKRKFKMKLSKFEDASTLCSVQEMSVLSDLTSIPETIISHRSTGSRCSSRRSNSTWQLQEFNTQLIENIAKLAQKAHLDQEQHKQKMQDMQNRFQLLEASRNGFKTKAEQLTQQLETKTANEQRLQQELEQLKLKLTRKEEEQRERRPWWKRRKTRVKKSTTSAETTLEEDQSNKNEPSTSPKRLWLRGASRKTINQKQPVDTEN